MDELKKNIREGVQLEKESKEKDRLRLKFLDEMIRASKLDIPEVMVEKTLEKMTENFRHLVSSGKKTEEELNKELLPRAKHNVEVNLLLYKIAEDQKIDYDPKKGVDNEKIFESLEFLAPK